MTSGKKSTRSTKKTISIGGDVVDSVIINGDNNVVNYFTGEYASLEEYYIPPDSVFQRVRTEDFVGREWLTAKVDAFLNDPQRKSGAFLLIGDAGVGKTSFMAHLVRERGYLHLFAEQVPGQAMLQRALQSLGSQLVTRYQIDPYKDRDTLTQLAVFPDFLERLLRLAANTITDGERIVIVCDALDEAGTFPDGNVFGLPNVLPDGVYLILSQRPVNVKLPNIEPLNVKLEAQGADNLGDMEKYLGEVAQRTAVADQLRAKNYSDAFFIQTLKEKSLGVWMYLHYVIKEIEGGSRAPLDLSELPTGLVGYYAEYWRKWRTNKRGEILPKWRNLYAPILSTLAAAQDAITAERLTQWARVKANPDEVQALLGESWRAFVTEKTVDGKKVYAPYHLSFRDFITGKVDLDKLDTQRANLVRDLSERTVAAHARIVHAFEAECGGQWEKLVAQEYPRLHLSAHLNGAGEYEKLRILLTEGEENIKWAEAKEQKEETYAGYLNDLRYVWDYAEREQNYALAIRCMLIENSIHSLAANIPPELLAELAKAGIWSYARCLEVIREKPDDYRKAESLRLLAPTIPAYLHQEVLSIASKTEFGYRIFASFLPYLNKALQNQILSVVHDIKDEDTRIYILDKLAHHPKKEEQAYTLQEALEITNKDSRVYDLGELEPHLDENIKDQVLRQALSALHEIENEDDRAHALRKLIPHLNDQLKEQALSIAQKINDEFARAKTLEELAIYLNGDNKVKVIQDILANARETNLFTYIYLLRKFASYLNDELKEQEVSAIQNIYDEVARADALREIAPYLKRERKTQLFQEMFSSAQKIRDEFSRTRILLEISPYLNEESKTQVLQTALSAARKIGGYQVNRANMLGKVGYYLDGELKGQVFQEALSVVRKIKDEVDQHHVLRRLAPYLSEDIKTQALDSVRKMEDHYSHTRVRALKELAPYLSEDLRVLALSIAREITDEYQRALALKEIAPYLNENLKRQAFLYAQKIKNASYRSRALGWLAPHLSEDIKAQALQEGLAAGLEAQDVGALGDIAIYLPEEIKTYEFEQALQKSAESLCENESGFYRNHLLGYIAPCLNEKLILQVFQEFLLEIKKDEKSFDLNILINVFVCLKNDIKTQMLLEVLSIALSVVRKSPEQEEYVKALGKLWPYLKEDIKVQVYKEVRSIIQEIKEEFIRHRVLGKFALFLDDEIKVAVLQEVFYFLDDPRTGLDALDNALCAWQEIGFKGLEKHLFSFIKFKAKIERKNGMNVVASLTPALVHFSGEEIAPELYRAIQDVARWWP